MAWSEFLIIIIVAIIVLKPEDLPKIIELYKYISKKFHDLKSEIYCLFSVNNHNEKILEIEKLIKEKIKKNQIIIDQSSVTDTEDEYIDKIIKEEIIKKNTIH